MRAPMVARPASVLTAATGVALLVLVAALVAVDAAPGGAPDGLRDPGGFVRWGVPVGRLLLDVSAVVTIGGLLVAAVLSPPAGADPATTGAPSRARRSALRWAVTWAAAAPAVAALTVWDVAGVGPLRLPVDQLLAAAWALPPTRALLLVAALAVGAAVLLRRVPGRAGAVGALVVAAVAVTPPLYVGHAAHVAGDEVATGALVVHVLAASVWLGGLAGLVLHVRPVEGSLPAAADRFSALALGAFAALVLSGALVGATSLGTARAAWTSPYAVLLGVKVGCAVALGLVGWSHRRWTLARLRAGRPRAFQHLVAAELVLMGAAAGVAVALSRTPGASSTSLLERPVRAVGPGGVAERLSVGDLVADWRPEPVLTTAVVVALVAHHRWVRAQGWSSGPTARAGAGLRPVAGALLLVAVVGLPTRYDGHPLVGVQGVQLVVLLLLVPALAAPAVRVLVGPADVGPGVTRPGRGGSHLWPTPGGRGWVALTDPAAGFVAVLVATVTVLATPVRVLSSAGPGRVLTLALVAGAGAVFAASVGGLAGGAGAPTPASRRAPVLALTTLFLGAFGGLLVTGAAGAGAWTAADLSDPTGLGPAGDPGVAGWVLCVSAAVLAVAGGARLHAQHRAARRRAEAAGVAGAAQPPDRHDARAGDVLVKG